MYRGCTYASEDCEAGEPRHHVHHEPAREICYGSAVFESFFATVKSEEREHFESCGDAKMALLDFIEVFYIQRRRHSTLG